MFGRREKIMLISMLIVIVLMVALFKVTGFIFHVAGKLLGGILGIIGWLILGGIAVTIFGLALFVVPIILIVGIVALVVAAL